jgi:4-coumarate--CoA ligase
VVQGQSGHVFRYSFFLVAAGLRCTLANSSYTPKELAFQYSDSGAKLVFTHEDGISTVLSAFEELGISREEGKTRIVILDAGVEWVGGLVAPRRTEGSGLLRMQDLLQRGVLAEEEKFDGKDCHETAYICYSSGKYVSSRSPMKSTSNLELGTTGKPKGVEVRGRPWSWPPHSELIKSEQTTHQNFTSVLDTSRPLFQATHNIDSILGFLPFYHMYGTCCPCWCLKVPQY